MIYNTQLKKIKEITDCPTCPHFDGRTKTCKGLNKICFEYDPKTNLITDGRTKERRSISEILI